MSKTVAYTNTRVSREDSTNCGHVINWGLQGGGVQRKDNTSGEMDIPPKRQKNKGHRLGGRVREVDASSTHSVSYSSGGGGRGGSSQVIMKSAASRTNGEGTGRPLMPKPANTRVGPAAIGGESMGNESSKPKDLNKKGSIGIEEYYADKGISYQRLRKNNYIQLADGLRYDVYEPPSGYSVDDLPEGQALSQTPDILVSPAVRLAEQQKLDRQRIHRKVPDPSDADDLLKRMNERRGNKDNQGVVPPACTEPKEETSPLNQSFPDGDDSFLMLASQQVESAVIPDQIGTIHGDKSSQRNVIKRDLNGNNRNEYGRRSTTTVPVTSTPVQDFGIRKLDDRETPKTTRSSSRCRNRSMDQSYNTNQGAGSFFETSNENVEISPKANLEEWQDDAPRKLLKFDKISPIKFGQFDDDDEDDIFSQIVMPCVESSNSNVESQDKGNCDKTTLVLDNTDSFFQPDLLSEIDKLEEMAIKSASTNSGDSSLDQSKCRSNVSDGPTTKKKPVGEKNRSALDSETPRTRSRGMRSLSLNRKLRK